MCVRIGPKPSNRLDGVISYTSLWVAASLTPYQRAAQMLFKPTMLSPCPMGGEFGFVRSVLLRGWLCFFWAGFCVGMVLGVSRVEAEDWQIRRKDRWEKVALRWRQLFLQDPRRDDVAQQLWLHYAKRGTTERLFQEIHQTPVGSKDADRKTLALAQLYHRKSAHQRAFVLWTLLWEKRQRLQPWLHPAQIALWNSRSLQAQARFPEALVFLQHALQTSPPKPLHLRILKDIVALSTSHQQPLQALQALQHLVRLLPNDPRQKIAMAQILRQLRRYREASSILRDAIQKAPKPQRPMLWKQIAEDALRAGELDTALQAITQARRSLDAQHWLHRELDPLAIRTHRLQASLPALIQHYEQAVATDPQRIQPLLAQLYEETAQPQKAIGMYQQIVSSDLSSPHYPKLAGLLVQQGRTKEAIALMLQRQQRAPQDDTIAIQTLEFLYALDTNESSSTLQAFLRSPLGQQPRFLESLLQRATAWKIEPTQHLPFYERLCAIPPLRASCFSRWGKLLWTLHRRAEAYATWRRIESLQPPSARDLFSLALLLLQHERGTDSIPILERVLALAPKHTRARLHLAQELLKAGDPKKQADALFRRVLRESPLASLREQARKGVIQTAFLHYGKEGAWFFFSSRSTLEPLSLFQKKLYIAYALESQDRALATRQLQEALLFSPDDIELHRTALLIYGHAASALPHFFRLIELDPSHQMRYLPDLLHLAETHRQQHRILPLLQSLTQQQPDQIKLWRWLGKQALAQKQWPLAQQAFLEVLQREPNDTLSRLGIARLHTRAQRWKEAYTLLSTPPFPTQEHAPWQTLLLRVGNHQKVPSAQLLSDLQRSLQGHPAPLFGLMHHLQEIRHSPQPSKLRQHARALTNQHLDTWHHVVLDARQPLRYRWQAALLILEAKQKRSLPTLKRLLLDRIERLRGAALIGLAFIDGLDQYAWINEARTQERHHTVRIAAMIADAWVLKDPLAQRYALQSACHRVSTRWLQRLLWSTLALQPSLQELPILACLFRYGNADLQRDTLRLLAYMPPSLVPLLKEQLRQPGYSRCFLYQAFRYLSRHPEVSPAVQQAARTQPLDPLADLCRSETNNRIDLPVFH